MGVKFIFNCRDKCENYFVSGFGLRNSFERFKAYFIQNPKVHFTPNKKMIITIILYKTRIVIFHEKIKFHSSYQIFILFPQNVV